PASGRHPARPAGRRQEERHALAGDILPAPVVMDGAEEEVAPFLPPERPFRRPLRSAKAVRQRADGLGGGDDLFELGGKLLDLGRHGGSSRPRRSRPAVALIAVSVRRLLSVVSTGAYSPINYAARDQRGRASAKTAGSRARGQPAA